MNRLSARNGRRTGATMLVIAAIVVACSRSASLQRPADSARLERNLPPAEAIRVPDDVSIVCDSVAATWRRVREAKVVTSDTVITPRTDDAPGGRVEACQVVAMVDSIADSSRVAATYWRVTRWPELLRWHADGPDGESGIYQRALARCEVARQWDGGDDADTTVAISPFQQETTLCWHHLQPLAVTDTGFPVDSSISQPAGDVMGSIIRRPKGKNPPR